MNQSRENHFHFILENIRVRFTVTAKRVGVAGALRDKLHVPLTLPSIVMELKSLLAVSS
jgi:hypothetical protein